MKERANKRPTRFELRADGSWYYVAVILVKSQGYCFRMHVLFSYYIIIMNQSARNDFCCIIQVRPCVPYRAARDKWQKKIVDSNFLARGATIDRIWEAVVN